MAKTLQEEVNEIYEGKPKSRTKTGEESVNEMIETDGKDRSDQEKAHSELEELLGIDKVNPYGTTSLSKFKKDIANMNRGELHRLCMKVGAPWNNIRRLSEDGLIRSFSAHQSSTGRSLSGGKSGVGADATSRKAKKAKKELDELLDN